MINMYALVILHFGITQFHEAGFKKCAVLQDEFLKLERQKGKAHRFW